MLFAAAWITAHLSFVGPSGSGVTTMQLGPDLARAWCGRGGVVRIPVNGEWREASGRVVCSRK